MLILDMLSCKSVYNEFNLNVHIEVLSSIGVEGVGAGPQGQWRAGRGGRGAMAPPSEDFLGGAKTQRGRQN